MTEMELARNKGILVHAIVEAYQEHCYEQGVPADVHAMPEFVNAFFWKQNEKVAASDRYRPSDAWSHSKLSLYERCPASWAMRYGPDRIRRPSFVPVAQGEYTDVLDICLRAADIIEIDAESYAGSERWYHCPVGEHTFRGRLDCVHIRGGSAYNIDWKSGWESVATANQMAGDYQMRTQAMLLFMTYPHLEVVVNRKGHLRWGTYSEPQSQTREMAEATLTETLHRIEQVLDDGAFEYTPGDACSWCEYADCCERVADAKASAGDAVAPVTDGDTARRCAEEMVLYLTAIEARKAVLKPWVKGAGPVEIAGMEYGTHSSVTRSYPARAVVEAFEGTDENALDELTVPKRWLASALKRNPQAVDAVEAAAVETVTTRCDLHKVKGASNE